MPSHIDPSKQSFAAFRADDRPGPIHMLNLVRLRPRAAYPDDREATGAEAYAAFASVIRTTMKTGATSVVNTLHELFGRPIHPSP